MSPVELVIDDNNKQNKMALSATACKRAAQECQKTTNGRDGWTKAFGGGEVKTSCRGRVNKETGKGCS